MNNYENAYFNTADQFIQWKLNDALYHLILGCDKNYSDIAVVCIGSDRSTGDSFGPLTGHMLSKFHIYDFKLYGTFENPVHALTLRGTISQIDHKNTLVIAVDSCMGNPDHIGYIGMGYEPIKPGSGLGKELPTVGDISITGTVAMGGIAPFLMLQNAPLGLVYDMAEKTSFAMQSSFFRLKLFKSRLKAQLHA